ncbi:MAG: Oxidoreductase [Jatrophihabitantaceae bacterium]|nr:Oxidoreductase [Jatrophihabitantaceae bacterium]
MASRPRSGIIGTGFMGAVHARAVRGAGGTVAAVAGSSFAKAQAAAGTFGAERAAESAMDIVLAPDIDIVHICTPNHLHAEVAAVVIAAGKHVICEKPLTTTTADSLQLAQAAAAAGVLTAVPFAYRYYGPVREARAQVAAGRLGRLRLVHGQYLQDWLASPEDTNWRVDPVLGGASRAFADIGVHWCDLVEYVTGERIAALTARLGSAEPMRRTPSGAVADRGNEDIAVLLLTMQSGAVGTLTVSQVSLGRANRLSFSLDGSDRALAFDQESAELLWIGRRDGIEILPRGSASSSAAAQRYDAVPAGHPQGYQDCFTALMRDVYARLDGDDIDGLPDFQDGLRAAHLTDAVLESHQSGSWVEVGI